VVGPYGVTLHQAKPVTALPGFSEGMVSVQDPAAQLAAPLLLSGLSGPGRLRVLDACAAPGGKTAHLLELAGCDLTALDVDPLRCERIHQTLQRLGLQARCRWPTRLRWPAGGTGSRSTPSCWTHPVRPLASARAPPRCTLAAPAGRYRATRAHPAALVRRPGRRCGRWAVAVQHLFRFSRGGRSRSKRSCKQHPGPLAALTGPFAAGFSRVSRVSPGQSARWTRRFLITPCSNSRSEWPRWLNWLLGLCLAWAGRLPLRAQAEGAEVTQLQLERSGEAVLLSASIQFELPQGGEEALLKGIPVIFVAEADVFRERWYWTNKKVVSAQRHMRLAYQPLTRRWRLHIAAGCSPWAGHGIDASFETLPDALAAVQRISRWKIADGSDLEPGQRHLLEFRFRLDASQLPRPLQIGTLGDTDWSLSASAPHPAGGGRPARASPSPRPRPDAPGAAYRGRYAGHGWSVWLSWWLSGWCCCCC